MEFLDGVCVAWVSYWLVVCSVVISSLFWSDGVSRVSFYGAARFLLVSGMFQYFILWSEWHLAVWYMVFVCFCMGIDIFVILYFSCKSMLLHHYYYYYYYYYITTTTTSTTTINILLLLLLLLLNSSWWMDGWIDRTIDREIDKISIT